MLSLRQFDAETGRRLDALLAARWDGGKQAFAVAVGVDPSSLSKWISGEIPLRKSPKLPLIAATLGVGVVELLCGGAITRGEVEDLAERWDQSAVTYEDFGGAPQPEEVLRGCAAQLREKLATPLPSEEAIARATVERGREAVSRADAASPPAKTGEGTE